MVAEHANFRVRGASEEEWTEEDEEEAEEAWDSVGGARVEVTQATSFVEEEAASEARLDRRRVASATTEYRDLTPFLNRRPPSTTGCRVASRLQRKHDQG